MEPQIFCIRAKPNGTAKVFCPNCHTFWLISVEKIKTHGTRDQQVFKLLCPCLAVFCINLELRRGVRKKTSLRGYYERYDPKGILSLLGDTRKPANCWVNNLTREGIGISTFKPHRLNYNDEIVVQFSLDNEKRSEVTKRAVVRMVNDNYVGCEFIDPFHEDKEFAFYLF